MRLFLDNDRNGDGVLELSEFSEMIRQISSSAEEREISALYEEANAFEDDDDPDSISKESFADLACKYHFECPSKYLVD
jgi:hypothetical protein